MSNNVLNEADRKDILEIAKMLENIPEKHRLLLKGYLICACENERFRNLEIQKKLVKKGV